MRHEKTWLILLLLAAIMLTACGRQSMPDAVVIPTPDIQQHPMVIPPISPAVLAARERLALIGSGVQGLYFNWYVSLEETMFGAEVIARVGYLSKQGSVVLNTLSPPTTRVSWLARLEFRFRVHEYLKGSGPDEIGVFVHMAFDTEADARVALPDLVAAHDGRWDNREAIVFASTEDPNGGIRDGHPIPTGPGQYWFMSVGSGDRGFIDKYTVASEYEKLWLPAATSATSTARTTSATEKRYMLGLPATSGGARSASTVPTISLSNLKSRIAALEAEATAGGTEEYRDCVESAYKYRTFQQVKVSRLGDGVWRQIDYTIGSGLPAGTVVWEYDPLHGIAPDKTGMMWTAGPDADLFRYENDNFRPNPPNPESVVFRSRGVTVRPLPAGTYRFHPNMQPEISKLCSTDRSIGYNRTLAVLEVERPAGVPIQHEAFFDPVDIGDAVGADGTNGVIKPAVFSLGGEPTTIESLKWEDGTVTMELSPTASLADYTLDFIDVTGTTTLSLSSENASTTALTWTVPDKPWNAGDLLMLRIHRPISTDATLSNLALSGVDLAFDPATTTYAASVPATTTQTTVTPTTNHASATYVVKLAGVTDADGTIPLAAGDNVITIDVTAEDTTTTQTYTITLTRPAPPDPVTVTLTPRVEGPRTRVNITIEWNDPQTCDGQYLVALYTSSDYMVQFLGYTPASETPSRTTESATNWVLSRFPDWFAGVTCYPNASSAPARDLGRVSLRAAHPDSN